MASEVLRIGFDGGCLARVLRDRGGRGQLLLVPTDWRCVPNAMRGARPETGSLARFHLAGTSARCSEPTTRHVTITHITSTVHPENTQPSHMRAVAFWQNGLVAFQHPLDCGPRCAHPARGTRPHPSPHVGPRSSVFVTPHGGALPRALTCPRQAGGTTGSRTRHSRPAPLNRVTRPIDDRQLDRRSGLRTGSRMTGNPLEGGHLVMAGTKEGQTSKICH